MVRERLTGLAPPANAKALVEAWRKDIERDAGADLDKLAEVADDQREFAMHFRNVLNDLGIGDEFGVEQNNDDDNEASGNEPPPPQADNSEGQDESRTQAPAEMEMIEGEVDTETDRTDLRRNRCRCRRSERIRAGRARRKADPAEDRATSQTIPTPTTRCSRARSMK